MKCELCKKLNNNEEYKIEGAYTELIFGKELNRNNYYQSPYKIFAYGEGIASIEIYYCPMCRQKIRT